jgi:hypothetical protein
MSTKRATGANSIDWAESYIDAFVTSTKTSLGVVGLANGVLLGSSLGVLGSLSALNEAEILKN